MAKVQALGCFHFEKREGKSGPPLSGRDIDLPSVCLHDGSRDCESQPGTFSVRL